MSKKPQTNHLKFGNILICQEALLTIQATSVPCEQMFSVAGNTITKTRNRLKPETACATLCLKSWIENGIIEEDIIKN